MFKKKVNLGFWEKLRKPVFVIAPMAGVTDVAFRQMFAKNGKPDVMWTEFVSCDGLVKAPSEKRKGQDISSQEILWRDLMFFENERPIVAQIFSADPKMMKQGAYLVAKAGFDGIDLNMGCPVRTIQKQKTGAALIKDPKLAVKIIRAAKKGIEKACKEMKKETIPLSVKTRLGYNQDTMEDWLSVLLKENLAAITLHARTKKELSKVPAKWDRITDLVKLRDEISPETLILGNGDVNSLEEAKERVEETGCDGVMIGRGVFGNPWFFANLARLKDDCQIEHPPKPLAKEDYFFIFRRLMAMVEHTKLFEKYLPHKNFNIMKKHYKAYVNGFKGAKELREKLMNAENSREVEIIIRDWLKK
jgi:nifR3 family TIM-barrel protein